jgi:hypothetical protein
VQTGKRRAMQLDATGLFAAAIASDGWPRLFYPGDSLFQFGAAVQLLKRQGHCRVQPFVETN